MSLVALIVAAGLYVGGLLRGRAAHPDAHWPALRTLAFAGGLVLYTAIEFGFLGAESHDLRWAFTTRVALLIFIVPALVAAGRPLELAQRGLGATGASRIAAALRNRVVRLFGNAVFATLFVTVVFVLFLTPVAWVLRGTPWIEAVLGVLVPVVGLAMVLPIIEGGQRTSFVITVEFMLAFLELLLDAVPGIVLRLNTAILDGAPAITNAASWWPSQVHDQHLAGDLLWFIAEVTDVPILVLLLMRWHRTDRREAGGFDELSDEEYERLTRAHLRDAGSNADGSDTAETGAAGPGAETAGPGIPASGRAEAG